MITRIFTTAVPGKTGSGCSPLTVGFVAVAVLYRLLSNKTTDRLRSAKFVLCDTREREFSRWYEEEYECDSAHPNC